MALRYYEGMFLFDSTEASKDWPAMVAHVEAILKKHGAQIIKLDKWDDRKLAYDIGNVKRGTYLLGMWQMEPTEVDPIRRECELSEFIMRQLFLEDAELLSKVKEREELKKKREAEAAQAAAEGLPIEGERGRYGDRPRFSRDRDREERPERSERGPRRDRAPAPVAAEDIEVPDEMNQ